MKSMRKGKIRNRIKKRTEKRTWGGDKKRCKRDEKRGYDVLVEAGDDGGRGEVDLGGGGLGAREGLALDGLLLHLLLPFLFFVALLLMALISILRKEDELGKRKREEMRWYSVRAARLHVALEAEGMALAIAPAADRLRRR